MHSSWNKGLPVLCGQVHPWLFVGCGTYQAIILHGQALCSHKRKNGKPHKLCFALSPTFPHCVLGANCTCTSRNSGFCNHVPALWYQIRHVYAAETKSIPEDVSKSIVAQVWDKPRVPGITPEPIMNVSVRKVKLEHSSKTSQFSVHCMTLEQKTHISNDDERLSEVQHKLWEQNLLYGTTYIADPEPKDVNYLKKTLRFYTLVGIALIVGTAPTEGNFDVFVDHISLEKFDCDSCWTLIWLSRNWAWLCRGYWRYRSLIDCFTD